MNEWDEKLMENWPELPEDFEKWIEDVLMKDSRYLFFRKRKAARRGSVEELDRLLYGMPRKAGYEAWCSHCRRWVDLTENIKHGGTAQCTNCGTRAEMKSYGTGRKGLTVWDAALVMQVRGRNVYAQTVDVKRIYPNGDERVVNQIRVRKRWLFEPGSARKFRKAYLFENGRWNMGWEEVKAITDDEKSCMMYPLPDFAGTALQHSHMGEWMKLTNNFCPMTYLGEYSRYPGIEHLVTEGLERIVMHKIIAQKWARSSRSYDYGLYSTGWEKARLNWNGRRPRDILKLSQPEVVQIRNKIEDMDFSDNSGLTGYRGKTIKWMIWAGQKRLKYTDTDIKAFTRICAKNDHSDGPEWDAKYALRTIRYLDKQKSGVSDYGDYLRECAELGYNLDDDAIRYPSSLEAAHQRTMKIVQWKANEKINKKFAELEKALRAYTWQHEGLIIRPARAQEELTYEGKKLSHCVGGYADNHLDGRSIFFIRRAEAPDEPYYTLQLNVKQKTVIQNRGLKNCDRTPEVQAFEDAWLAHIRALKTTNKPEQKKAG